jgi:hypothetical protein
MTTEDLEILAKAIGDSQGEMVTAFAITIKAIIKSQPNFNHQLFLIEMNWALKHPNTTPFQTALLQAVLK